MRAGLIKKLTYCVAVAAMLSVTYDAASQEYLREPLMSSWPDDECFVPSGEIDAGWWEGFNDPVLDSLVKAAVDNNFNILTAIRRIEIAKNTLNSVKGRYFPTLALSAGWTKTRTSGEYAGGKESAMTSSLWQGGLSMSWEIDVFGRVSKAVEAQKARVDVSKADRAAVLLSVEAEVASSYITFRSLQQQLAVAQSHAKSQQEVVKMTEVRYETGLASKLDVAQARRVYYTTVASIPMLENEIHKSVNAIAVLLGESPDRLRSSLEETEDLPDYRRIINAGLPADLLVRRPDVVAARKQIAASAAEIGIAKKDYLPVLSFNGSIGTTSHDAKDLFTKDSFTYSIAPTLSWTLFDGLQRKYNVANAKQQMEAQIDSYNTVVLSAFQEADNAMSTYLASLRYITSIEEVVKQSEESLKLAVELYKLELSAFTNVVDAQLAYLESQQTLVEAKGSALTALVDLYKALGGGWDVTLLNN